MLALVTKKDPATVALPSSTPLSTKCPPIQPAMYQGLAGDIVRTIEPYTEAHPVAILGSLLAAFGNIIGPQPRVMVEETPHPVRLFVALVGPTAHGRKGQSWSTLGKMLDRVSPEWAADSVRSGLASGEGLISLLEGDGKVCLIHEEEFGKLLTAKVRDGSTLSPNIRNAWDGRALDNQTKHNSMRATNHHLSLIVHITPEELASSLTSDDTTNGFGNRFLWLYVQRTKRIYDPMSVPAALIDPLIVRLQTAITWAKQREAMKRSPQTRELWWDFYSNAGEPRVFGALLNRAEPYVLRIALAYALLDQSPRIELPHLEAAIALWQYSEASLKVIFGDTTGDPKADRILEAIIAAGTGGKYRSELYALFRGHITKVELDHIGELLTDLKRVVILSGKRELWQLPSEPTAQEAS